MSRALLLAALVAAGLLIISLALPVEAWRTGEPPAPPLVLAPGESFGALPTRIWIDTDAACGHDRRTDPDDCLALLFLARSEAVEIAGVSTLFGNASLAVTDRVTRSLMGRLRAAGSGAPAVHRGASSPASVGRTPARDALRAALAEGPLILVALGPLTNIAAALRGRPDLQANVVRLVAVMGRREGHLFHPIEGGTAPSFLGHGPVFRDFNYVQDEAAAAAVLAMRLPATFVPYEAAREVMITEWLLEDMARRGGAAAWVSSRSRGWLGYWREDIGLPGFYPFDLIPAAYVVRPSLLRCGAAHAAIEKDIGLLGWLGVEALVVRPPDRNANLLYCPDIMPTLPAWLDERLTEAG